MKKILSLFLLCFISVNIANAEEKLRVAVFDPTTSGISIDDGTKLAVQELISSAVVNTGLYTMVERSMIDQIIREQSFQNSDLADSNHATEIGKLAGANKIILSAVSLVGGRNMLSIKMIDVMTATVEKQRTKVADNNDLLDIIEPLTYELINQSGTSKKSPGKKSTANFSSSSSRKNSSNGSAYDAAAPLLEMDLAEEHQMLVESIDGMLASIQQANMADKKMQKVSFVNLPISAGVTASFENGILTLKGSGDAILLDKSITTKIFLYVKGIIVEEGITKIPPFSNFSALQCVKLPNTLTALPARAFSGCRKLLMINMPSELTHIGEGSFFSCKSLGKLVLPNSVTNIGVDAFNNCEAMTFINIPTEITNIPQGTFRGCESLTSIIIPESVTTIGKNAFRGCKSIAELYIPNSVTSISESTFHGMKALSNLRLSESITNIPNNAFDDCQSLTRVVLPESVVRLGNCAFEDCKNLYSIELMAPRLNSIGEECFEGCEGLSTMIVHSSFAPVIGEIFEKGKGAADYLSRVTLVVKRQFLNTFSYAKGWSSFINITPMVE